MYGAPYAVIGAAAADVAGHCLSNLVVRWVGRLAQQRGRSHNLPRLAISALRDLLGNPCLLQRLEPVLSHSFDGDDLLARHLRHGGGAGADRRPLHVHGARAAESSAAAVLGPVQVQGVAKDPEKRGLWLYIEPMFGAVDAQSDLGHEASMVIKTPGKENRRLCGFAQTAADGCSHD